MRACTALLSMKNVTFDKVFSRACVIDGRVTVFLPPEMKGKTPNAYNWLGFEEGMVHP